METALKVFSWIEIVIGSLAIISSVDSNDMAAFVGGSMFLAAGVIALVYIKEQNAKI